MSSRIPIPETAEALLRIAECLDRMWVDAEARGHVRLTLEEECRYREQQSETTKT